MKSLIVAALGFGAGWWLYRAIRNAPPEDEVIRDPSHEFGSSTGG
jgi:hypothetical protein